MEPYKRGSVLDWIGFYGIGATICVGRESWCLLCAGFFLHQTDLSQIRCNKGDPKGGIRRLKGVKGPGDLQMDHWKNGMQSQLTDVL